MRYVFGDFELDTQRYELRQAGALQPLEPQGFNVLAYRLEHHDRVVSKDELLEQLWPGQHVTEATLTQRLVAVRQALGDSGRQQQYIKTLQRRGYRFIAPLTRHGEAAVEPEPVPMPTRAPMVFFSTAGLWPCRGSRTRDGNRCTRGCTCMKASSGYKVASCP